MTSQQTEIELTKGNLHTISIKVLVDGRLEDYLTVWKAVDGGLRVRATYGKTQYHAGGILQIGGDTGY